jgi:hypothetical protein
MTRRNQLLCLTAAALTVIALLIACGGGGGGGSGAGRGTSSPATVNVTVSDPATCSAPASGPYSSVWVTISDVQIHTSATAADNDPNWFDLTPNLKNTPQQVDLLAAASNQCFLATLGSTTALQPGTYQQIRIILADNASTVANNHCGATGVNCVILAPPQTQVPQALALSSESKTGMKIPSGQIAGGKFTIASGETKDLNIDFDTCASIVVQGNGQFRLKPALHAGEVALTSNSISGKVVDKATNLPIAGGKSIVALEQKDASGVERVILQTTPDNTGAFNFCPVPAGTYEVVAVAVNGANVAYAATITSGVQPGNALGNIPMTAVTGASTAQATITGDVTTANASNSGTGADVLVSALQNVALPCPSGQVCPLVLTSVTIPVGPQSATLSLTTEKTCLLATCPTFTASYSISVPPMNPTVGAFVATGTTYTAGAAGNPGYAIEGQAFVPQSGGTADCAPPIKTTPQVSVNGGTSTAAPTLAFTGCQ